MTTYGFRISYDQADDPSLLGKISFAHGVNSQVEQADGRLDFVDAVVTATGFIIDDVPNCSTLIATITLRRTTDTTMDVLLQVSGPCLGGYGYGYGYGYGNETVNFQKLMENVPIQ